MTLPKYSTKREYYQDYKEKIEKFPELKIPYGKGGLGITKKALAKAYLEDRDLNSLPLDKFDLWACCLPRAYVRGNPSQNNGTYGYKGLSLGEVVSIAKDSLIFDVLGVEPEFSDDE